MYTREKFLNELAFKASLRFNDKTVHEILLDYDDYIDIEMKESMDETSVINNLNISKILSDYETIVFQNKILERASILLSNSLWRELILLIIMLVLCITGNSFIHNENWKLYCIFILNATYCLFSNLFASKNICNSLKSNRKLIGTVSICLFGGFLILICSVFASADCVGLWYDRILCGMILALAIDSFLCILKNIGNIISVLCHLQIRFGIITLIVLVKGEMNVMYYSKEEMLINISKYICLAVVTTVMCNIATIRHKRRNTPWMLN